MIFSITPTLHSSNLMKKTLLLPIVSLGLSLVPCQAATLAGLWLFDDSSNPAAASVGNNLVFGGASPGTWSASLADNSSNALTGVVTTPAAAIANRFTATHGIAANGGGLYVNQYSIVVDLFTPAANRSQWRTIMQTNQTNANDGDLFIRPENLFGVADLTYSATALDPANWTRLVVTFDLGSAITSYSNGILLHNHSASTVDGRFSLDPTVLFFADNDGDDGPLNIGALAIYDGALSAVEVAALGAAGAPIPEPSAALLGLAALGALAARQRRRA